MNSPKGSMKDIPQHIETRSSSTAALSAGSHRDRRNHSDDALSVRQLDPETASVRAVDYEDHPNAWAKFRYQIREPVAEFIGTMILVIFGAGVDCQVVLSSVPAVASSQKGSYLSISLGWGIGTALGVWASAGISGGHINPAVTLAQVVFRRFPLRKLPIYFIAQVLGGFTGALLVYANYWHAIDLFEGHGVRTVPGTAGLFTTFPLDYMTAVSSFFSEFLATAILLIIVFAITDPRNSPPSPGLVPLVLFLTITGIGASLGMQTAYALNPARDLGPRLMTWIFYGKEVWNYRNQYWLWTPFLGPFCGAVVGAGIYDLFVFTGDESRVNSARFCSFRSTRQPSDDPEKAKGLDVV